MANRFFPLDAGKTSWSSTVSESWSVTETTSASGRRRAICQQAYPQLTFGITFPALTDEELATLTGFYAQCKGALLPFYYKDALDYRAEKQALTANASGGYPCVAKTGEYVEPVSFVDNVTVYVDGEEDTGAKVSGGIITPSKSGAVTASYDYYRLVKFSGGFSVTQTFINVNTVTLSLVTVR